MLSFLETGKYKYLYKLVDEKMGEYKSLINELKILKITEKKNVKLNEEIVDRQKEDEKLKLLLNF
jgi:hypothetical protein